MLVIRIDAVDTRMEKVWKRQGEDDALRNTLKCGQECSRNKNENRYVDG